jgi:cellulase
MKFTLPAALLVLIPFVAAHGTMSGCDIDGVHYSAPPAVDGKSFTRTQTPIRQVLALEPLGDLSTPDNRCGRGAAASAELVAPAKAGSQISFTMRGGGGNDNSQWPHLAGPVLFYMAKCPGSAKDCKPDNLQWFKIQQLGLKNKTTWWQADLAARRSLSATIPKGIQNGDYLFRVEILALHNAMNVGGAETTVACGQLRISGGSGGVPSGKYLTKFPSYSPKDKGILVNIWDGFSSYTFPGPPVYSSGGAQGGAPATTKPSPKPTKVPVNVAPGPSKTPSSALPAPTPTNTKVCRRRRSRRAVVFDAAEVGRRSTHHNAARRYASLH